MKSFFLPIGIILYFAAWAFPQTPPQVAPVTRPAGPERVFVGLYINDVYELDLKRGTYIVDFYVWLRWKGDIDPTNIEFLNGSLDLKEHPDERDGAGFKYISYHCRGTFHSIFDYRRFPLDEHELCIKMEDANHEADAVEYVVDEEKMSRLPTVALAGWRSNPPTFRVVGNKYETNFGDPTRAADSTTAYSRFICTIRVSHRSFSIYIKTFLALFISVAIAFLSFVLKPTNMDPRFGVGLAAIFGAVSSEIVMSGNLPDMPYLTLADKLHLFSLFVIFLTLLQSCLSLWLFQHERIALAKRIDRVSLVAFPLSYAFVVTLLTSVF